ncbi:hypothetical protein ACONUD_01145 [Microbulbifer harenosus]|uniref:Serine acetyltransferase n=1 Tax=Microbulbifer harenosus TaxID=2576840 RepID=A0ABY2UNY0_9GAMM|nr:hypothetical protein [Microbulbifer harenosus]TLM80008.1 hypothetical protein FDY93_01135 [Microbulbifer harenosus]
MNNDPAGAEKIKSFIGSLPAEVQSYILQDIERWVDVVKPIGDPFERLWSGRQEFRSLIQYRMRIAQKKFEVAGLLSRFRSVVGSSPWMFVTNLFVSCDNVGPGFYIEHGFSTVIFAKSIGKNFWVNQNVTIGSGKGGNPTILDNVSVRANSVVIGNITVANGVVVGAGAILNFDVPEGSKVVMQKPRVLLPD